MCLCVTVCISVIVWHANMTLAMTSPEMSLSGCTLHPTLLRKQTGLISVDRPREHRTAAFYCCHSNFPLSLTIQLSISKPLIYNHVELP